MNYNEASETSGSSVYRFILRHISPTVHCTKTQIHSGAI